MMTKQNFSNCVLVASKIRGIKKSEYKTSGQFPIIDQGQNLITAYSDKEDLVEKDFPFIIFGDHTRVLKYINFLSILSNDGIKVLRPKSGIDSKFLYYQFLNFKIPNTGYNRHFKYLVETNLVIPEIEIQQKIALILSTVDEEIQKTDQIIQETEKLKNGLMSKLLTKGIGHSKFKKTKIGKMPEGWKRVKLTEISYITKLAGYEFTKYFNSYKKPGEIIVIRGLNLKKGILDLTGVKTITKTVSDNLTRSKLKNGDLVFSYVGTIGPIAIITEDDKYHLGPNVCKISPNNLISSNYLYQYFLSDQITKEINKKISITAQPSLSMEKIRDFEILLPSINEQNRISEILVGFDKKIKNESEFKNKLVQLKNGLMNDIFSQKVEVKN